MSIQYLVTHSGGFHADELLSSVILTRLFPDAKIVRSRAPDWITPATDRIIYDVGGAYDANAQIFDHHQRGAPLREDGQPFSSFGLVWKHYGKDYLAVLGIPVGHVDAIHESFDTKFVLPIDLLDNGALSPATAGPLADLTLPSLLENPGRPRHRRSRHCATGLQAQGREHGPRGDRSNGRPTCAGIADGHALPSRDRESRR